MKAVLGPVNAVKRLGFELCGIVFKIHFNHSSTFGSANKYIFSSAEEKTFDTQQNTLYFLFFSFRIFTVVFGLEKHRFLYFSCFLLHSSFYSCPSVLFWFSPIFHVFFTLHSPKPNSLLYNIYFLLQLLCHVCLL